MALINVMSNSFVIVRLLLSVVINIFMTQNNLLLHHFYFTTMNSIAITSYN